MNGSFGEAVRALDHAKPSSVRDVRSTERVAERIERLRVVGLEGDQLAQPRLSFVDAVELLARAVLRRS